MPNLTKMDKDRSSSVIANHTANLEKSGHKAYNEKIWDTHLFDSGVMLNLA
ncbi:hypothetical protein [Aeromonas salmonicida]|uniref:hypothetical protein n=1 Tax=Aeromonas salmonicida TaxID=645 RepID=UPI0013747170|nr:hypothetical protein [Aeromonas salmonicida]